MIIKLIAFVFLFTVMVNGYELSPAAATQPTTENSSTAVRSENGQSSLIAMFVGFLRPADVQQAQQDNEGGGVCP